MHHIIFRSSTPAKQQNHRHAKKTNTTKTR